MEVFGQLWRMTGLFWYPSFKIRGERWWETLPMHGQLWRGNNRHVWATMDGQHCKRLRWDKSLQFHHTTRFKQAIQERKSKIVTFVLPKSITIKSVRKPWATMDIFGQLWRFTVFLWYSSLKNRGQLWWATLPMLGQLWRGNSRHVWATMDGQQSLQFHQTPDPSKPFRNASQKSSLSFFRNPSRQYLFENLGQLWKFLGNNGDWRFFRDIRG